METNASLSDPPPRKRPPNTGKHSVGERMVAAFIMGYGIGITVAAQFVEQPVASFTCLFIGFSLSLFAFLWDWNRDRAGA